MPEEMSRQQDEEDNRATQPPRDSSETFIGIPLVNRAGDEPKIVGTADVKLVDTSFNIVADITDEEMLKLFRPKSGRFSIVLDTFQSNQEG